MLSDAVLAEITALLTQARTGDARALDALIAKCLPYMKKYLPSALGNENRDGVTANSDIIMDAAARAARKFPSFQGTTAPSFLSWLKRIVVRRRIDAVRWDGRKKRTALAGQDVPVEIPGQQESDSRAHRPSARLDAIETWLRILSALLALPQKQRESFWLCCICERSQEEVADRLGRSRAAIAGEINRARTALQDVLRSTEQTELPVATQATAPRSTNVMPVDTLLLAGCFDMGPLVATGTVRRVFRGSDRRSGGAVAISVLNYEHCSSPESVARFVNESFWLRSISELHVAAVLAGGMLPGGQPFLVQEWLPISLADILKQGPLSPSVAQSVIQQIVRAIAALHATGLVHRDISPARFRVSQLDVDARYEGFSPIKLTSLRLAKPLALGKIATPLPISTVGGALPGASEYRAPELWLDPRQAGERADVYSIGALWYALLLGSPPFVQTQGESVQSLMQRCLHADPSMDRLTDPPMLLTSMLAKAPSARPTLAELSSCVHND